MAEKRLSWNARRLAWRNRIYASPSFQKWSSAIWPISRVARGRAQSLFDLVAGFAYSQTLLASVEADLFALLEKGPASIADIARHCSLPHQGAERLIRAAAGIGLAEEVEPGRWMLGKHGAALQANHGAIAMIRHHRLLYADLADPLALLRANRAETTQLSRFWSYDAEHTSDKAAEYSALMAASHAMVAEQTFASYDFSKHNAVLDVGGGHGAFAMALAERTRGVRIGIFDFPAVLDGTEAALRKQDMQDRISLHPGDFFQSALPRGYDCITLNRILHDHDDEAALAILKATRKALPANGRLLIAEPMAGSRGAEAMGDTYFGLYLWAMNAGKPRTIDSIGNMLREAGFRKWHSLRTRQPVISSCIVSFV